MTRLSKRELEQKLEDLDEGGLDGTGSLTPEIEERRSDAVVSLVYGVCRDLLRLTHHHPDEVVNEPDDAVATKRFLEMVRDEYGIEADSDRDERVIETLVASTKGDKYANPVNAFEMAPVGVATHVDVHAADGTELAELVEEGREEEAERALVQRTYDAVAGDTRRAGGQ